MFPLRTQTFLCTVYFTLFFKLPALKMTIKDFSHLVALDANWTVETALFHWGLSLSG